MVCASFPQILTSDLFESYGLYDQVCDFEPLFRVLLELYSTEVGDKSSFKYAFVSLITIIGLEVYALIMKTWEQWNSINSFPSSYLQLSRKWSNDFFHSLKRSNYDYVQRQYLVGNGLSSTIRSQKKQLFSCSIRPSTTSLKQELSNGISFEDICPLLSRQAYEALIPLLHPAGGLVSTNCTPNTLTSHLAAEELRKSLTSELSSPDGWKMLFGNINDNGASDSSINLVRSSPGNRTRLLGALVKLLNQLAAHSNFNVVLCSLDIASMLVEALRIHTFCSFSMPSDSLENQASLAYYSLICDFFPLVKKALADSKLVVRAAGTKLALAMARPRSYAMLIIQEFIRPLLAQRTSCSRNVFECAEPNLHAVRLVLSTEDFLPQECVDLVTSLLLTLPSSEFDLPDICKGIIQVGLMNPKHSLELYEFVFAKFPDHARHV
ncbi:unnamed protein product [Calicophoron daubneyi]|uniref:Uncharacterized protein n=1 Tax=Calicophoron daubneyi TaxID=300641 RepID=A0AAV2T484_CALDB